MEQNTYFETNRESWNARTQFHKDSSFYNLEEFKKGGSSLNAIEVEEMGDVKGRSILHLQCHFGMDTMSWSRLGAKTTGVDFSDEAIQLARNINEELKLDAEFICCNVYDIASSAKGKFDIVFTSYGTIGWLPDLDKWAKIIHDRLQPGGFFYMVDFHPVVWMMDDNLEKLEWSYFNQGVIETEQQGTYADRNAPIRYKEYGWNHPFSEIINSLVGSGLKIEKLNEYPFSPYPCFKNIEQGADGMWRIKGMGDKFPMLYSLRAGKR